MNSYLNKRIAMLLALTMSVGTVAQAAAAAPVAVANQQTVTVADTVSLAEIVDSGTYGDLTWTLDSEGTLTISGTGEFGYRMFYGDESIKSVVINEGVTEIGENAFAWCSNLTSVTIPDSVITIGKNAFFRCKNLTALTIPRGVTSIGGDVFTGCTGLMSITVDASNQNYCDVDGVLYNKEKTELLCYPSDKSGSFTIPEGVTEIGDYAFFWCENLTNVTIPNSVTTIGSLAFQNCSGLTSITIPDSVITIKDGAFGMCDGLTAVTIPNSVTTLGSSAFGYCAALTEITLPEGLKEVDESMFEGCSAMSSVTIPSSVTSIGDSAFLECDALTDVYFGGTEGQFGAIAVGAWNDALTNATIHYNSDAPVFTDVPENQWYYNAVNWAVENKITAGYEDNTFRPDNNCTRAQIVQFLYNQAGKPAYTTTESPFTDVQQGAWYYDAVLWAVENGITSGMGDGTFGVNNTCTREQAVTFLWNAQGKPVATSTEGGFTDVPAGQWYYNAVLWGVENKVTAGMGNGTFGVGRDCTRAAIVQFLYNLEIN